MVSNFKKQSFPYRSRLLTGSQNAVLMLRNYQLKVPITVYCKQDTSASDLEDYGTNVFRCSFNKADIVLDYGKVSDYVDALTNSSICEFIKQPFNKPTGGYVSDSLDDTTWYNSKTSPIYLGNSYAWENGKTFTINVTYTITRVYYNGTDNYIDITSANKDNFFFIESELVQNEFYILDYTNGIKPKDFLLPTRDYEATVSGNSRALIFDFNVTITNHFNESVNLRYTRYRFLMTPIVATLVAKADSQTYILATSERNSLYISANNYNGYRIFLELDNIFLECPDSTFNNYIGLSTFTRNNKTYNSLKIKHQGFCTYLPYAVNITNYKNLDITCTKAAETDTSLTISYKTNFNSLQVIQKLTVDFIINDAVIKTVDYTTSNSTLSNTFNLSTLVDVFVKTSATIKSGYNQYYKFYFDFAYAKKVIKHYVKATANYIKMFYNSFTIAGGDAQPGYVYLGKIKYINDSRYRLKTYSIYNITIRVYYCLDSNRVFVVLDKANMLNPNFLRFHNTALNNDKSLGAIEATINSEANKSVVFMYEGYFKEHNADNIFNFKYFTIT